MLGLMFYWGYIGDILIMEMNMETTIRLAPLSKRATFMALRERFAVLLLSPSWTGVFGWGGRHSGA